MAPLRRSSFAHAMICGTLSGLAGVAAATEPGRGAGVEKPPRREGTLTCRAGHEAAMAFALGTKLHCEFKSFPEEGVVKKFLGTVERYDVGDVKPGERIVSWTVFSVARPHGRRPDANALRGTYARIAEAEAEETGFHGDVLVGGQDRIFVLQPRTQPGWQSEELAARVLSLELRHGAF